MELTRYSSLADLSGGQDLIAGLWREAFRDSAAAAGRDFDGDFARHAGRRDFQLLVARDPHPVGFAYGYSGERGQWWPEWVASAAPAPVVREWLDVPHLEVVELAVAPAARGRGIGRSLLEVLLHGSPHARAVLTTESGNTSARHLYRETGWQLLVEDLYPGWCLYGWTAT